MSRRAKLLLALVVLGALALVSAPFWLALVTVVLLAGSQQQSMGGNPCVSPVVMASSTGQVRLPVVGSFVATSEYGMRSNPGQISHGQYRLHGGIDLAQTPAPSTIVAALDGVVTQTPTTQAGGNAIRIDHGGGVETYYAHLASRAVKTGDQVWAGRAIGTEGSTGNSTGPHLHFEVHIAGERVNPRGWLTQKGVQLPPPGGAGSAPGAVQAPATATSATGSPTLSSETTLIPVSMPTQGSAPRALVSSLPPAVGPYKGTQIEVAAAIIKKGQERGLDTKTITLAVMTGMGESDLINVNHGDSVRNDTIGVFQEGPERGPYAQRMDPAGAADIFYDYLLRVPNYLSLEPTIAAHKAQANRNPYHYRPKWPLAVQMVSTLTADPSILASLPAGGGLAGCLDGQPIGALGEPGSGNGSGAAILTAAKKLLGVPYSWGGGGPSGATRGIYTSASLNGSNTVGVDCSGLVIAAVAQATGITLPHSAEAQGKDQRGRPVPRDWAALQPGDVISFSEDGSGAAGSFGHVGIYAGDGQMIHAPRPGKPVQIVQLRGSTYYEPMAWSIRRFGS